MITFLDQRSREIVAEWQAEGRIERIREMSGWRPFPGLPLPSIVWLQRHRPDIHAAVKRYLGPADFCIRKLTGHFATDLSAAEPERCASMQRELEVWFDEVNAERHALADAWPVT